MSRNHSYFHRGGDIPLTGNTIGEHFIAIADQFADRPAVIALPQKRRLSYSELAAAARQVAKGLLGLGFKKGDRIGIWATNNVEWLLVQLATALTGMVLVNINPAYRPKELAYAVERSRLNGLVTIPKFRSSNYIEMLSQTIPELQTLTPEALSCSGYPELRRVIVYDPAAPLATTRPQSGFTLWSELERAGDAISDKSLDELSSSLDCDDPINIQYTSGTTGFPKAVLLTHHNILNNALFTARAMHFSQADKLCIPVPFYHCFGMVLSNLLCFSVGACAVIPCEHFDAEMVLEAVANERCTAVHGVPTMFIALLEDPKRKNLDLSCLRTGIMAGAPCPEELMKRVMTELHCSEILIGYGETEASPLTHLTAIDDSLERRTQTVGRNLPHQEVKVVDHGTGATVKLGEIGEICFRGYHIMQGYFGDEKASKQAIDEHGWLHSGDLGTMDNDGYVRITGRLKDMIIRGGENIYPREIEEVLFTHPKIAEAAVFGIPDEYYGEEVMAWVQLHQGESMDENELKAFCKERMAHFKVPRYVRFVNEFPMTVTGKLQKFRMREMALADPPEHLGQKSKGS